MSRPTRRMYRAVSSLPRKSAGSLKAGPPSFTAAAATGFAPTSPDGVRQATSLLRRERLALELDELLDPVDGPRPHLGPVHVAERLHLDGAARRQRPREVVVRGAHRST